MSREEKLEAEREILLKIIELLEPLEEQESQARILRAASLFLGLREGA